MGCQALNPGMSNETAKDGAAWQGAQTARFRTSDEANPN
jgi:hypothetical protein